LDIGVLGYIGIVQHKKHSPEVLSIPPGTPCICRCRGKAIPLEAWSGPECSRKLRLQNFKKTAQDGGKIVRLTHRPPLSPGNTPGTHFC